MNITTGNNEHNIFPNSVAEFEKNAHAHNALESMASHDLVTGLPDRDLFFDRLSRELARVRRYKIGFALVMLELNEFEYINDANRHATVDLVINEVARLLISTVRDIDTVARINTEEFAILLDGVTSKKEAELVANKIGKSLAILELENGIVVKFSPSMAIVLSPQDGDQAVKLMMSADQAMNKAKNNGSGQFGIGVSLQSASDDYVKHSSASTIDDMNLGISIMDAQHKSMANYIKGIIDSLTNGDKSTKLLKRVELLIELCQIHFQTEEDLMTHYNLPGVEDHRAEHQRRLKSLRTLFKNLNLDEPQLAKLTRESNEWLLEHIREQDAELAAQLKNRGAS